MTDRITKEQRSKNMSHIRSKDTSIELKVRKYLFSLGYRYRVNYKELPGKPDIVFTKKKIAIFIHGCYWHGHNCNSRYAHISKSNTNYWNTKIQKFNAIKSAIKEILNNWKKTVGKLLCFGNVR